ncbi:MAG: sulfatase-like hydrolase/transferase [Actinomycetales bacterium]|nr:sulfatase-like hydrolase/transferase [Actinomycetales bacterium]
MDNENPDYTGIDPALHDPRSARLSRRRLLQAAGAVGLGAAALGAGARTAEAAPMQPFRPRGRLRRRPNFLIFMVDEMRTAPSYESAETRAWRERNLQAQNFLRRNAMEFTNHHIMAVACQPSRASIYTGQYPTLHGVSQTSGSAKSAIEEDLYWLQPGTVPTLGNYFRAAGYDTYWKGKWHISDGDIYQPGSYNPLPSYNANGVRDPYLESVYEEAGMLEQYGFTGWIGPEPHGSNPLNSGSSAPGGRGRDEVFAQWGIEKLLQLRNSTKPWLLVNSFVNPHDITLWGDLTLAAQTFYLDQQLLGSDVPRNLFTPEYAASQNEDLSGKPTAQGSYRDQYPLGFQPLAGHEPYQRFYYQLQKNVDDQISRVIKVLTADKAQYRDTIVVFLSDHGEQLGSHGGLFQKWSSAYDETVRVPFLFHNPILFDRAEQSDLVTSHADFLPTMLGLAGLDEEVLRKELRTTHTEVQPLVGRDLSGYLLGENDGSQHRGESVYFMTDDQIFKGMNAVSWKGTEFTPVEQPASLEAVFMALPTGPAGEREMWKLVRYFDNPDFWTSPGVQDVQTIMKGRVNEPGPKVGFTTVKALQPTGDQVGPAPDEWELYCTSRDPMELSNLYGNPDYGPQLEILLAELNAQNAAKRRTPTNEPWADGSAIQFGFNPAVPIP